MVQEYMHDSLYEIDILDGALIVCGVWDDLYDQLSMVQEYYSL